MTAESKRSDQVKKPSASSAASSCRYDRTGNQRSGLTFAAIRFGSFFPKTNTRTPLKGPVRHKGTSDSHLNNIIRRR